MLLLFLLLSLLGLSPAERNCHPNDETALLKFKNSFSNSNLLHWAPGFDCCSILKCNETTNRVIELTITNSDLSGAIPAAVADLTYLQTLRLHHMPFLIGEIPPAIAKLKHLLFLDISYTNISGEIPPALSNLKSLMFMYLSFNKLTGSIPPSLSKLPNIIGIDLSRNQLTGPIPESFGHFPDSGNYPGLLLSHNKLSGEIPAALNNTDFSRIDLSRNNFTGDASMFSPRRGSAIQLIYREIISSSIYHE